MLKKIKDMKIKPAVSSSPIADEIADEIENQIRELVELDKLLVSDPEDELIPGLPLFWD
jgi:hypothetical protein